MSDHLNFVKKFILITVFMIIVSIIIIFILFYYRTDKIILNFAELKAKSIVTNINNVKNMVASTSGIYIKDKENNFIFKNPCNISKTLSTISFENNDYSFKVINCSNNNCLDSFEKDAFRKIKLNNEPVFKVEKVNEKYFYRYITSIAYNKSCLNCHKKESQALKNQSDIALSLYIPINDINNSLIYNKFMFFLTVFFIISFLISLIIFNAVKFSKDLILAQKLLLELATTDGLTKLLNRTTGLDRLEEEISRHIRGKRCMSCMLLDIDNFKYINDTYGHQAGDIILVEFSAMLKDSTRKHDIISRYGGEEFLIILPDTDIEGAKKLAEKIRSKTESLIFNYKKISINITTSIGLSHLGDGNDLDVLINIADNCLYSAKNSGRNKTVSSS